MAIDFTIKVYKQLLNVLVQNGYRFQTYYNFEKKPEKKIIILRHDVDSRKENSLQFARIQYEMGILGTYYFRLIPQSFDKKLIREIASMGHEIGYHYEDMDFAKGDLDKAYELAKKHLAKLREVTEIKTICMHGSPRSPYDNKEVWKKYDYRKLGIIAEPYFDLDFSKVLYLTDTGRRWDGEGVSVRDKVTAGYSERSDDNWSSKGTGGERKGSSSFNMQYSKASLTKKYSYRSTHDIIEACKSGKLPNQIMMNYHPQRWTDHPVKWTQELVWQNLKNVVKWGFVTIRS